MLLFSSGFRLQSNRSALFFRADCISPIQLIHSLSDLLDLLLRLLILLLYLFNCQPALAFIRAEAISRERVPRMRKHWWPELVHLQGWALESKVISWVVALSDLFLELPAQGSFCRFILIPHRVVVDYMIGVKPLEEFLCIVDIVPHWSAS